MCDDPTYLARLLYARVMSAHEMVGAPIEPFGDFAAGDWDLTHLGTDGVIGFKLCPENDGDSVIVALPTNHSPAASRRVVRMIWGRVQAGRKVYSAAWKNHTLAVNINVRMGARALGETPDGYFHFVYE